MKKQSTWLKCKFCKNKYAVGAIVAPCGGGLNPYFPACKNCMEEKDSPIFPVMSLIEYCRDHRMKIVQVGK